MRGRARSAEGVAISHIGRTISRSRRAGGPCACRSISSSGWISQIPRRCDSGRSVSGEEPLLPGLLPHGGACLLSWSTLAKHSTTGASLLSAGARQPSGRPTSCEQCSASAGRGRQVCAPRSGSGSRAHRASLGAMATSLRFLYCTQCLVPTACIGGADVHSPYARLMTSSALRPSTVGRSFAQRGPSSI